MSLLEQWLGYRPYRVADDELMDDPSAPRHELFRVYEELEQINLRLGGHAVSLEGVRCLVVTDDQPLAVLDVGSGGGDFARYLAAWAQRAERDIRVQGLELSSAAVEYAEECSNGHPNVTFRQGDLFDEPDRSWDIVHMSLTLHHFDDEGAVRMLREMARVGRRGIVVNDLHRHPVAYAAIKAVTRVLSRSPFVRNDAPLSVNRGFTRDELHALATAAGLDVRLLGWRPMYRYLLVASRAS
ncbi:MAG: methyltransferase domain-containing protein [Myxococcota bacterium]